MFAVSIIYGNESVSDQWEEMNYAVNGVGEIGWQVDKKRGAPPLLILHTPKKSQKQGMNSKTVENIAKLEKLVNPLCLHMCYAHIDLQKCIHVLIYLLKSTSLH